MNAAHLTIILLAVALLSILIYYVNPLTYIFAPSSERNTQTARDSENIVDLNEKAVLIPQEEVASSTPSDTKNTAIKKTKGSPPLCYMTLALSTRGSSM
jgi:hypothetical protein